MTKVQTFYVGDVQIDVTPSGDVHVFGADNVVTYGNLRLDATRLITNVDNNCPNRTEGGQIIKFVHAVRAIRPDDMLFQLAGGEAAAVNEVHEHKNEAVLEVRLDGNPEVSHSFFPVAHLVCRK